MSALKIRDMAFDWTLLTKPAILASFQEKLDNGLLWSMAESSYTRQIAEALLAEGLIWDQGVVKARPSRQEDIL